MDTDPGWINRRFREQDRKIRELRAERKFLRTTIPDGFISTAALADPSAPGYVNLAATNFAVTTTGGNVISTAVSVPSGFTSCVISLVGRVYAVNSTAADDYLLARVEIDTATGTAMPVLATANGTTGDAGVNVAPLATVLAGLPEGDSFNVRLHASTATANWTADVANTADLNGSIVWFA
jgi:hypothetical protein